MEDLTKLLESLSEEQRSQLLARARASAPNESPITFKVSEKGAVSVYGLQRFPVTLYAEQWEQLIPRIPQLTQFINENRGRLKTREGSR